MVWYYSSRNQNSSFCFSLVFEGFFKIFSALSYFLFLLQNFFAWFHSFKKSVLFLLEHYLSSLCFPSFFFNLFTLFMSFHLLRLLFLLKSPSLFSHYFIVVYLLLVFKKNPLFQLILSSSSMCIPSLFLSIFTSSSSFSF